MERALIAVQQTAKRVQLQRDVVASTRRAFEIAETRLREGTVDLVTVLNTQTALFQAQDALAQAQLERLTAVVAPVPGAGRRLAEAPDDGRKWVNCPGRRRKYPFRFKTFRGFRGTGRVKSARLNVRNVL